MLVGYLFTGCDFSGFRLHFWILFNTKSAIMRQRFEQQLDMRITPICDIKTPVHKIETFRWWHSNQFMHESKADKRCIPLLWCDGNLRATQVFTFRSIRWVGDIDRSGVLWRWFPCWTGTRILLVHQFWNPLFRSFKLLIGIPIIENWVWLFCLSLPVSLLVKGIWF